MEGEIAQLPEEANTVNRGGDTMQQKNTSEAVAAAGEEKKKR